MTCTALVVAYRDANAVTTCLASLKTIPRVLVVNVTADPDVSAVVAAEGHTELALDVNVGYAGAVNAGVRHLAGDADTVLFMNDDVSLLPPWLSRIERSNEIFVPHHRSPDGKRSTVLHSFPSPRGFLREWILGLPPRVSDEPGRLPSGVFANGAAVLAPRSVLEAFPLPEEYFMYWEETAWFWRLADAAQEVRLGAFTVERPEGRQEFSELKAYYLGRNLIRLARERYGPCGAALYVVLGISWLGRLVVSDSLHGNRSVRWNARRATAKGLFSWWRSESDLESAA